MRKKLKAVFTRNIGMKLLSFVLAFLVWIIIMSISDPQITKRIDGIPIETKHRDDFNNREENKNLSIEVLTSGTLSIKVKGSRSNLENLNSSDFIAYADFDEIGVNSIPIHVETRRKDDGKNIEITYQSKPVLQVSLVKSKTKLINVVIDVEKVPENRYAVCRSVSSKLLEVTGPEQLIETVSRLTATVDVSGMIGTTAYVSLAPVDQDGNVIEADSLELSQSTVQVEIVLLPVKEVSVNVDLSETPVVNGFGIYDVKYSPVTVRVAAEEDTLKHLREITIPYDTEIPLIKGMKPITRDFDITKYLPEGVYLKSGNAVVSSNIVVEAYGERTFTFPKAQLTISNLSAELRVEELTGDVSILIEGFKPDIERIGSYTELKPYVDLGSIHTAGVYTLPVLFGTDAQLVTTGSTVEITLTEAQ